MCSYEGKSRVDSDISPKYLYRGRGHIEMCKQLIMKPKQLIKLASLFHIFIMDIYKIIPMPYWAKLPVPEEKDQGNSHGIHYWRDSNLHYLSSN